MDLSKVWISYFKNGRGPCGDRFLHIPQRNKTAEEMISIYNNGSYLTSNKAGETIIKWHTCDEICRRADQAESFLFNEMPLETLAFIGLD